MRMKGRYCPEAWAWWLLAKLLVPERVGFKVLPIPTKSRFIPRERPEALGEYQEPPRIHAGEVSEFSYPSKSGYLAGSGTANALIDTLAIIKTCRG